MAQKFRVLVHFKGSAAIDVPAESVEEARRAVENLELADIARVGHSDVLSLEVAIREIRPMHTDSTDYGDPNAPEKPRPSGWYRP